MVNYELPYFKEKTDAVLKAINADDIATSDQKEAIATIIQQAYEDGIKENPPDEDYLGEPERIHDESRD